MTTTTQSNGGAQPGLFAFDGAATEAAIVARTARDARQARDSAIQRVHDGATQDERDMVRAALDAVIERGRSFTSEDVIAELGDAYALIREPRLLGAIIQQARRAGRIVPGVFVNGTRHERHSAPVRQWHVIAQVAGVQS